MPVYHLMSSKAMVCCLDEPNITGIISLTLL
jgi:hypothetical protein